MTSSTRFTILALLFTAGVLAQRIGPDSAYPAAGIGRWDPAVTQDTIKDTICQPGYTAAVRNGKPWKGHVVGQGALTESIKAKVYVRDGKTPDHLGGTKSHCCEIDHFYPLELGGANVIDNLWAQRWDAPYGARQKDHGAENRLNKDVCAGKITLDAARARIATDWVAVAVANAEIKQ